LDVLLFYRLLPDAMLPYKMTNEDDNRTSYRLVLAKRLLFHPDVMYPL